MFDNGFLVLWNAEFDGIPENSSIWSFPSLEICRSSRVGSIILRAPDITFCAPDDPFLRECIQHAFPDRHALIEFLDHNDRILNSKE